MNVNTIDLTPDQAKAILADGRLVMASRDEVEQGQAALIERKALRARVAQLEGAIRKCQAWRRLEIYAEWPEVANDMDVALSATPAQSLARVRAEAVGEALALIKPNTEYWADVEALKERLEAEAANG